VRRSHNGTAEKLEANYSWLGGRLQASYLKLEKHYLGKTNNLNCVDKRILKL
jgi:hypothetical protein